VERGLTWQISKTVSHSLTGERTGSYNPLALGRMLKGSSSGVLTSLSRTVNREAPLAWKFQVARFLFHVSDSLSNLKPETCNQKLVVTNKEDAFVSILLG
jgi:hypothetical protein